MAHDVKGLDRPSSQETQDAVVPQQLAVTLEGPAIRQKGLVVITQVPPLAKV